MSKRAIGIVVLALVVLGVGMIWVLRSRRDAQVQKLKQVTEKGAFRRAAATGAS